MSNQIVISSGAKVRELEGVLTGTSGIVISVPLGAANGVATLDSGGKVPVSQLPSSVVTYLGTWNAATNTPTLVNGTGDAGDMYICNVAGTVNFGAGPITFAVGDWVLYGSGTWQKSSGQNGTVTSVAASITGNAIGITGSPITTAGTLALAFAGTSGQYINGAGNLVTFPTIVTEAQRLVTEVYNETGATLTKGTVVYINGGHGNLPTVTKAIATGDATSAQTYGVVQTDITNMNNGYVVVIGSLMDLDTQAYANGTQLYLSSTTAGAWTSTKQYAPAHLVYVGIVTRSHPTQGVVEVKIQNGFELDELHNVSAQTPSNGNILQYVSSTQLWTAVAGTTSNIAEGTNLYYTDAKARGAISLTTTGSSGAATYNSTTGVLNVPNYNSMVYPSAGIAVSTGTAWGTSITDNSANWNSAYSLRISSATAPLSITSNVISISQATTSTNGYLSSSDFVVFNNKQAALTLTTTGTSGAATLVGATLNIPNYTPDLSNYVNLTTAQTVGGTKTFTDATKNNGGIFLQNGSSNALAEYMNLGGLTNGLKFTSGGGISNTFTLPSATGYTFTFPNATGTIALLEGTQTISGNKTFSGTSLFTGSATFDSALQATIGVILPMTGTVSNGSGVIGLGAYSGGLRVAFNGGYTSDLAFQMSANYVYTFPASSGTIALVGGSGVGTVTSVAALTIGTTGTDITSTVANSTTTPVITLNVPTASATNRGALSSTDWTTFNNKQSALTNPVTGTGTTNYLPKFTGASTIGNSQVFDNGTNVGIGNATPSDKLNVVVSANGNNTRFDGPTSGLIFQTNATTTDIISYGGTTPAYRNLNFSASASTNMTLTTTGNLGLGVTPSAWSLGTTLQIGSTYGTINFSGTSGILGIVNAYYNGSSYLRQNTGTAFSLEYNIASGNSLVWRMGSSDSAGTTTSLSSVMALFNNGNLLITNSTLTDAGYKLDVNGTGRFSDKVTINQSGSALVGLQVSSTNASSYASTLIYGTTTVNGSNGFDLIGLYTNGTARFRVDGTGAATFSSSVTATQGIFAAENGNATDYNYLIFNNTASGYGDWNIHKKNSNDLAFGYGTSAGSSYTDAFTLAYGGAATFYSSVTATSFFESSDSKLKTLIQDNYQTKGIASITPKLYTKNGKVELGYYAQDFVGVLDSAVSKGNDDMLSLSYREVHTAKIYALEQEIKELKAKLN